jgi:hypothetical protein
LPGGGRAAPAFDHDNPYPTWSRHVDLHSINDRTHDQQAAAAVGAAAGNRNQTWIKARALVTDLQPAPGVIEVYAYPIRQPGRGMAYRVGAAFAEGEGEILTNGSRHPGRVEKSEECAPRHRHGPVGCRQLQHDRGNHHTSPKPTRDGVHQRSGSRTTGSQSLFHICVQSKPLTNYDAESLPAGAGIRPARTRPWRQPRAAGRPGDAVRA